MRDKKKRKKGEGKVELEFANISKTTLFCGTGKMNKRETITVIRSLLSSTNSSCTLYSLNEDFKRETGVYIPLFGYGSLSEFLESIPDTVKVTGMYPMHKVSLVQNDVSGHIVSLVKRQRRQKKSKKGVSNAKYFSNSNRPVNCKQNKGNFKQSDTKQKTTPPQAKAKGVQPTQQTQQRKPNEKWNKKKIIMDKAKTSNEIQKEVPCLQTVTGNRSVNAQSSHCTTSVSKKTNANLPAAVVCNFLQANEKLEAINLRLHCNVGDYIEVHPCEIFHPGHFYLHLRKFKKKLSMFMDLFQQHYNRQEISSLKDSPKVDQICVVRYTRYGNLPLWYRAQVEEILTDSLVVVRLVDYGTSAKILTKNLKPLHRDFASFPTQAVSGSLANIKPSGSRWDWSKAATKKFHELAFCRDLVGGVVSMDYEECSLSLALTSTVGKEVHINDTLVEEGFAKFVATVVKKPSSHLPLAKLNLTSAFNSVKNCSNNSKLQKMFESN